jgi:CBS domain-containing protein
MTEPSPVGFMPVSALIADTIVRVAPDASLLEVADALVAGDVGVVVVGDGDRPAGIVSERDLVHAMATREPLVTATALDVASTQLAWCDASASVAEVAEEMCERYVRHLLVEEDGALVGVVSARDLLGVYASADMDLQP